jgi:DNA-binding response OmpR family regulator
MGMSWMRDELPIFGRSSAVWKEGKIPMRTLPGNELPERNERTQPPNAAARNKVHVLVVDDEKMIRSLLKMSLQRMGYEVSTAEDGAEALAMCRTTSYDLVLLDILMPKVDGFTVCAELRRTSDVPVVMLTALNRPDDIVRGLEMGADNYITKPFTFKEVEARIRAILRRTTNKIDAEPVQVLEYGDVRLDGGMRAVTVSGNLVELTRNEYQLLHYLMTHVDTPVSKEDLLERVWGYESADSNSNIVELAIRRLRKKLEEDPSDPHRLLTVRGVGYKFSPQGTLTRVAPPPPKVHHRHPVKSRRTPQPNYVGETESNVDMEEF